MTESKLREARRARGWTQAVLATRVGVSASTVSHWERGVEPSLHDAKRLVVVMPELTLNDLSGSWR